MENENLNKIHHKFPRTSIYKFSKNFSLNKWDKISLILLVCSILANAGASFVTVRGISLHYLAEGDPATLLAFAYLGYELTFYIHIVWFVSLWILFSYLSRKNLPLLGEVPYFGAAIMASLFAFTLFDFSRDLYLAYIGGWLL